MEDLALLQLLGPTEAQALAQTMVRSGIDYTFNATLLEEVRARAVARLVAQQHRCVVPEKIDGSPPSLTTLWTLKSDDAAIPAIVTVAANASPSEIHAAAEVAQILNKQEPSFAMPTEAEWTAIITQVKNQCLDPTNHFGFPDTSKSHGFQPVSACMPGMSMLRAESWRRHMASNAGGGKHFCFPGPGSISDF